MKTIASILLKVWVKQFYIINAGFLFFVFFFFFGMVNGGQLISYHISLIQAMLSSPVFMAVVLFAWLCYNIKCILFFTTSIKAQDSSYIYTLGILPAAKQWELYLLAVSLVYMPVLIYSLFIICLAIQQSMFGNAALVATYQLLMIATGAWMLHYTINKNTSITTIEKITAAINSAFKINLGYNGFLFGYILDTRKIAFAMVKVFSILMLSISFVINGDHFDEDLFGIFYLLVFVAHATLVFYVVDFSETQLKFGRNLPLAWYKVAAMYCFTYSIFLLPEMAFMLVNNHGNLPVASIVLLYFTTVATLFLCTGYLYGCGLNMESYLFLVFITFIMIFFIQKTGLRLLTLSGILLAATVVFKSYYHSFERE